MKVELRVVDWARLRKQQRRWQMRHHLNFLRYWRACIKEIVL